VASGHALPTVVPPPSPAAVARRESWRRADGSNAVRIAAATSRGPRNPSTVTSAEASLRRSLITSRRSTRTAPSSPPPAWRIARRDRVAETATTSSASCWGAVGPAPSDRWEVGRQRGVVAWHSDRFGQVAAHGVAVLGDGAFDPLDAVGDGRRSRQSSEHPAPRGEASPLLRGVSELERATTNGQHRCVRADPAVVDDAHLLATGLQRGGEDRTPSRTKGGRSAVSPSLVCPISGASEVHR
jgi:hypothetical protein